MRPYAAVRVRFSNADYDNVCNRYGGGPDQLEQWRDLGDLLHGRAGWHFNVVNDGEALWCLGVLGSSLLSIDVDADRGYFFNSVLLARPGYYDGPSRPLKPDPRPPLRSADDSQRKEDTPPHDRRQDIPVVAAAHSPHTH